MRVTPDRFSVDQLLEQRNVLIVVPLDRGDDQAFVRGQ